MSSQILKLNIKDFAKGLLMFVGAAVITAIYQFVKDCGLECVNWDMVMNTGISSSLAYLLKNFFSDEQGKVGGKF